MVASSRIVTATNTRRGVGGSDDTLIDDMLLTQCGSSPHIIRRRRDSPATSHRNPQKKSMTTNTRRMIKAELQRPFSPSNNIGNTNSSSNHIRRVRSDNLTQSKREDPSVRRSIFGPYLKEKPRSYSAPRLVRSQLPPPPPPPVSYSQAEEQTQKEQPSPRRSFRRSSSDSHASTVSTTQKNGDQIDLHRNHRRQNHKNLSRQDQPVDYRVFAPSEQQAATSAICYRYRELNRNREKEYDSLLERQVRVEHSLPPFPSPLIRFCSETTATVAGNDSHSSNAKHPNGTSGASCKFSSHDREIHYHGVYSLLTPVSVLRPSRYTGNRKSDNYTAPAASSISGGVPGAISGSNNESEVPTKREEEKDEQHLSASLASSFNFPRSYIETCPIFKTLAATATEDVSFSSINLEEEKKESDNAPLSTESVVPFTFAMKPSPFLPLDILLDDTVTDECSSSDNTNEATNSNCAKDACCYNDSKDGMVSTQLQQDQRLRFDPRVTVTEFEDPIPRKWYDEHELDQHKRDAIVVAQSYLREHPAVATWYRRATLDPVTNTYRKRALYSLPVFSSTYSSSEPDQNQMVARSSSFHQDEDSEPLVRKILIVDPNPAILSLLYKSMKSMFPSAEIVVARFVEKALRLLEESIAPMHGATDFDIIVVQQSLSVRGKSNSSRSHSKCNDTCFPGLLDIFTKKNQESIIVSVPSATCNIRCGSELIEQVCKLSLEQKEDSCPTSPPSCLLVGVSIRPERDAIVMRRAGADIVWGIPIPSVGNTLRNKLLLKLHAKRSLRSSSPSKQQPEQSQILKN